MEVSLVRELRADLGSKLASARGLELMSAGVAVVAEVSRSCRGRTKQPFTTPDTPVTSPLIRLITRKVNIIYGFDLVIHYQN